MAFYSYLSTKIIIMTFITKSYQNLFGVRSYINALNFIWLIKGFVYTSFVVMEHISYRHLDSYFNIW